MVLVAGRGSCRLHRLGPCFAHQSTGDVSILARGRQRTAALLEDSYIGGVAARRFGWQKSWLQFLPSALGLAWFAFYWPRVRRAWRWEEQMPLLLLVSLLTTAYGWPFDLVILLPAVIQITRRATAKTMSTRTLSTRTTCGVMTTCGVVTT